MSNLDSRYVCLRYLLVFMLMRFENFGQNVTVTVEAAAMHAPISLILTVWGVCVLRSVSMKGHVGGDGGEMYQYGYSLGCVFG